MAWIILNNTKIERNESRTLRNQHLRSVTVVFTPLPGQTGKRRHDVLNLSGRSSIHSFVCYQTCENDFFENESTDFYASWH